MILKYGVVRPTITKTLKVNSPGVVVYEIVKITRYPGGNKDPSTVTCQAGIDFTKKKTSRKLIENTWKGLIEENLKITCIDGVAGNRASRWSGSSDIVIFDSLGDAVQWKINETNRCFQEVKEEAQAFLARALLQSEKIQSKMKNILEENPEYFL